ncbi:RbtT/DalT/CsbX family MFS transporter [Bacillus siamensis]|uniref:MFS transporter n=1 Tax=Bacillus siamensis TaxID=659243 RepID=A0AAI8HNV4_9BACI|nr:MULTISPECIES: RbtT/DalT/CsbX family MFS transporter [Bacillus]AME05040.1 alpha-ketoglutarate permease [Bacillus sp. SDLI1]AUJ77415.1 MFS transporter [Bacillus siamensis]UUA85707.1 RbtT/DalT/CsbX family MFS transporter [Bacillus siamensis]
MLNKIGIPKQLAWGFLGVVLFMMGDGLEQGWLSPFLVENGLTVQQSASLFTVYGIALAVASWFSGVCLEAFGAKRTMFMGLLFYVIGTAAFIAYGFENLNLPVMYVTYFIKGLGYPLFAYSFLTWVIYRSPKSKLSTAVGWFWIAYCCGMFVFGAWYSSWAIKSFGYLNTLWSSIFWVCLGAFFALILNRDRFEKKKASKQEKVQELMKGITILAENPRVLSGGIVRIINSIGTYGFPVFLPMHMAQHGISTNVWLQIWGTIFLGNIVFNLIFGAVGDAFGWKKTVMWFGGAGCGIFTLLLYYAPVVSHGNLLFVSIVGFIWGGLLAGFVPIGAIVPTAAGSDKGAAMSVLNLAAGLSAFVGPALAWAFIGLVGAQGVVWIFAALYFASAILTNQIKIPEEKTAKHDKSLPEYAS